MTVDEMAYVLGVTRSTVYNRIQAGTLEGETKIQMVENELRRIEREAALVRRRLDDWRNQRRIEAEE